MANVNITGAISNQLISPPAKKVRVQVNQGWTGTCVLKTSPDGSSFTTIGTITNPSTGYGFEYWDVGTGTSINAGVAVSQNPYVPVKADFYISTTVSAGTCDITVNTAGNAR